MTASHPFPPIPARLSAGLEYPTLQADGSLAVDMRIPTAMRTPGGAVAPGALAMLVDSGVGSAVFHGMNGVTGLVTTHLDIELLRPIADDETVLRCVGRLVHYDGTYATGSGTVVGSDGEPVAVATVGAIPVTAEPTPPARDAGGPAEFVPGASDIDALLGAIDGGSDADRCTLRFVASRAVANNHGGVHGGMGALMTERTMDRLVALHSGGSQRLVALRVAFARAIPATGSVIECVAESVHRGRRISFLRAELAGADGRRAVVADATYAAAP